MPDPHQRAVHGHSISEDDTDGGDSSDAKRLDDFIRSTEVQSVCLERSPTGRYVRFMEKLGSGASKDVYRGYDTQEGIEVAWNVVNLTGVPLSERNRIVNEVRLLERLHHHNIISFHGSWVSRERQEVNFLTEILSSGTLKSFINKVQVIRCKIAKRWAVQILKGLEYLHSQDPPVIHRDLKCENVFINGTSGDLRIGDLGLSTVHRNGKALSVLGTPEFMAPDMYEDQSYDEKVDIYAFGMCMLEIFTKENPYSECENPARVYKKVSNGEPPEVLSRLQNRYARDFVIECLGYRDGKGKYVRPSATDLLSHPFLIKRVNDDDEIVVERPLHKCTIPEDACESSRSLATTATAKRSVDVESSAHGCPVEQKLDCPLEKSSPTSQARQRSPLMTASDEVDCERFEQTPESEATTKKVKVLRSEKFALSVDGCESSADRPKQTSADQVSQATEQQVSLVYPQDTTSASTTPSQFLVAAAVVENEGLSFLPHPDGVLKLVVTLQIEGQTQDVQFDFHLVEDDPIQVAKEMVMELGIPQAAVLEISEIISDLSCAARMRQEKASHNLAHQHSQQQISQPQHVQNQGNFRIGQEGVAENLSVSQVSIPSTVPEYSVAGGKHEALPLSDESTQVQSQPVTQHSHSVLVQPQNAAFGHSQLLPDKTMPWQAIRTQVPPQQYAADVVTSVHSSLQQGNKLTRAHGIGQQQEVAQPSQQIPPAESDIQQQVSQSSTALACGQLSASQHVINEDSNIGQEQMTMPVRSFPSQQPQQQQARTSQIRVRNENQADIPAQQQPAESSCRTTQENVSGPSEKTLLKQSYMLSGRAATTGSSCAASSKHIEKQMLVRGTSASSLGEETESEGGDSVFNEELRKLDEDFKKNLQRAKEVFDIRMDKLHRSQFEREAQHQKTVEKHHRERAEFDKRMAQQKEQQNRRMDQLRREWHQKRENDPIRQRLDGPRGRTKSHSK